MTDLPDEETIRVRRTGAGRGARKGTAPAADEAHNTGEARLDGAPARHRETFVDADGHEQTDGSTIVARRESRRRAAREQAGTAVAVPSVAERTPPLSADATTSERRRAAVPDPAAGIRYGVRDVEPVVVPRAAPPVQPVQEPFDAAGTDAARRSRALRRALIIVIAASCVALGAIATLVVITVSP